MMIDNAEAVRFCNEIIRPLADTVGSAKRQGDVAGDLANAKSILTLIPDTADLIDDGAGTDGRTPISGADVHAFMALMASLKASLEADSSSGIAIVDKIAVNIR